MPSGSEVNMRAAVPLLLLFFAASTTTLAEGGPQEGEAQRVRVDHDDFVITVNLGNIATYEEVPIFEVFFPTHDDTIGRPFHVVTLPDASGITSQEQLNVFFIHPLVEDLSDAIEVEACALVEGTTENCESVLIATRIPCSRLLLEIRLQQPVEWNATILRMTMPASVLRLDPADSSAGLPNPGIKTVMPVLSGKDLEYVEARPILRLEISPLTRDSNTEEGEKGREAVAFDFDGGLLRASGQQRYGLTWTGHVATEAELSFNQLAINLEYERNLQPGSFIPLVVALSVEADQDLDVVDSSARLELRFLLPFSVNLSPYHDFVPALGPKIELIGSFGRRLRGIDETVDESFWRLGYEVRWKIPLSSNSILRLHHAGLHDGSDSPRGDEFHRLWDVLLQTQIDELTYFLGFQEGEAAPLFQATETIRAGVVVSFE